LYCEWTDLWAHLRLDGDGLPLLVPLPVQAEGRVRPGGGGVPRLPGPLLLRAPGAMPGVPRAQEPRLRPGDRLGCQHGPAEARRCRRHGDGGAGHAARHDEIGDNGCEMAICFAPVVIRVATLLTVFFSSCDRRSECMYFSLFFPLS